MSELNSYTGNLEVIDGLTPANGQDFPLMQAHHIQVDEDGKRLDEKLDEIANNAGGGSDITIISLGSNTSYTLSSEQLAALNANPASFAFSISDSKLSGRTVILRYHASSTAARTYVSVYAYENTVYAYQCLVSIGTGSCTIAQNSYPIGGEGGTGSGSYVLELTEESGTLTDEQYNAVVANAPNVVVVKGDYVLPFIVTGNGGTVYNFQCIIAGTSDVENTTYFEAISCLVTSNGYYFIEGQLTIPDKTYVDNAVANASDGPYVLELDAESGTLTDEQYAALEANAPNVVAKLCFMSPQYLIQLALAADGGFVFSTGHFTDWIENDETFPQCDSALITVYPTKKFSCSRTTGILATKEYVDNAVSNVGGSSSYVLELTSESGTLTDEQFNAVMENAPNVVVVKGDYVLPFIVTGNGGTVYNFQCIIAGTSDVENTTYFEAISCLVTSNGYYFIEGQLTIPDKTYVDNAVANAGGGGVELDSTLTQEGKAADAKAVGDRFGTYVDEVDALLGDGTGSGSGGTGGSVKSITFTDRPSAWEWLKNNYQKAIKSSVTLTSDGITNTLNFPSIFADGEMIMFTDLVIMHEHDQVRLLTPGYFEITATETVAAVPPPQIVIEGTEITESVIEAKTTIPDEYWSAMAVSVTCYYIDETATGGSSGGGSGIEEKTFSTLEELALYIAANPSLTFLKAQLNGYTFKVETDETRYDTDTLTSVDVSQSGNSAMVCFTSVKAYRIVTIDFLCLNGAVSLIICNVNPLDGTGHKEATFTDLENGGITALFATT